MEKGWSAKGLLRPLWQGYPGKRDALAVAVGTTPSVLSALNTGRRNLGYGLGQRLADELGVSLLELGAPLAASDESGRTLLSHLEELAADLAECVRNEAGMARQIAALRVRVRQLEAHPWPDGGHATGQGGS